MAKQFHDGELEVVRGREDISYHEGLMSVHHGNGYLCLNTHRG